MQWEIPGQAEIFRHSRDLVAADLLGHLHGDGVDGTGKSLAQGHGAVVFVGIVIGLPAIDIDRAVIEDVVGGKAVFKAGKIDNGLENRPGLPPGHRRPVIH